VNLVRPLSTQPQCVSVLAVLCDTLTTFAADSAAMRSNICEAVSAAAVTDVLTTVAGLAHTPASLRGSVGRLLTALGSSG